MHRVAPALLRLQSRAGVPPALAGILRQARRLPYSPPTSRRARCRSAPLRSPGLACLPARGSPPGRGSARPPRRVPGRDAAAAFERTWAGATGGQQRQRQPGAQQRGQVINGCRSPGGETLNLKPRTLNFEPRTNKLGLSFNPLLLDWHIRLHTCSLCWAGRFMRQASTQLKDFTPRHADIKKAPVNTGAFTL